MAAAIKSRRPTGLVDWPLLLLEGDTKSGRTYRSLVFAACGRLSMTYVLELGERTADQYGAIVLCSHCSEAVLEADKGWVHTRGRKPACRGRSREKAEPGAVLGDHYQVLEHDGTYADQMEQMQAVWAEAERAQKAGEKPVGLVVDTATAFWAQLSDWVDARARKTKTNARKLAEDPNALIKAPNNLWNDANDRHADAVRLWQSFPGPVILIAGGREVAVIGPDGNPVEGEKTWKVEAQNRLPYAATAWVRVLRSGPPLLIGAQSIYIGMVPGEDEPEPMPDFTIEDFIFNRLRCDPATAVARVMPVLSGGEVEEGHSPEDEAEALKARQQAERAEAYLRRYPLALPIGTSDEEVVVALREEVEAYSRLADKPLAEMVKGAEHSFHAPYADWGRGSLLEFARACRVSAVSRLHGSNRGGDAARLEPYLQAGPIRLADVLGDAYPALPEQVDPTQPHGFVWVEGQDTCGLEGCEGFQDDGVHGGDGGEQQALPVEDPPAEEVSLPEADQGAAAEHAEAQARALLEEQGLTEPAGVPGVLAIQAGDPVPGDEPERCETYIGGAHAKPHTCGLENEPLTHCPEHPGERLEPDADGTLWCPIGDCRWNEEHDPQDPDFTPGPGASGEQPPG